MNNRYLAKQVINERCLSALGDLRKQLSSSIRERCKTLNHEDKVVYPDIQNRIKCLRNFLDQIYRFAECNISYQYVEEALGKLVQKQKLNRKNYKELSDEQAKEKACLAEVNREISKLTSSHLTHNISEIDLLVNLLASIEETEDDLVFHPIAGYNWWDLRDTLLRSYLQF